MSILISYLYTAVLAVEFYIEYQTELVFCDTLAMNDPQVAFFQFE